MPTTAKMTLPAPHLESRDAFEVTGMSDHFTFGSIPTIPAALWAAMNDREDEIVSVQPCAYGISYDTTMGEGFRYLAGYATALGAAVPAGMTLLKVPPGNYAVFVHDGHVSQIHQTMPSIFDSGLPDVGLTARAAPEVEIYDNRFDPKTGLGPVELWIPVE